MGRWASLLPGSPACCTTETLRHCELMLAIPILLITLCVGLCRWAAGRYEAMMQQGAREAAPTAHTGAEIAQLFLEHEEIADVEIVPHSGTVTNYFDPRRRRLFLHKEIATGTTMAAWTVALHEAAHATQTGDALGDLKWRQTVIKLSRYGPVFAALGAAMVTLFMKIPARFSLMGLLAVCVLFLLLNLGTLAVEFNANARLRRFLEKHLSSRPSALERLTAYLHRMATREVGDMISSPRYFFFSALPGSGTARPVANERTKETK